ncbi:MAG: 50S ribosomal protein L33 [Abditibacteriales bacterium]|nr:50S ribosomal protein L33 [Abditibacteriales bacterium]MDW8365657.1 50S ribosomal protein L33 [Abditibacteriales bacterium]
MAAKRAPITLACSDCNERNYTTRRHKPKTTGGGQRERLQRNKYCPRCRKHTLHRETR